MALNPLGGSRYSLWDSCQWSRRNAINKENHHLCMGVDNLEMNEKELCQGW